MENNIKKTALVSKKLVTIIGLLSALVLGFIYFNNLPNQSIRSNQLSGVNDYDFYASYNQDFNLNKSHFLGLIEGESDISEIRIDSLPLHSDLDLDGEPVKEGQVVDIEDISKMVLRPFVDQYDRLGWSAISGDGVLPKIETNIGVGGAAGFPPVANPDTYSTPYETSLTGVNIITENDTDFEGDTITLSSFIAGGAFYLPGTTANLLEGDLTITMTGDLTFLPAAGFSGAVPTVDYTIVAALQSDSSTIDITVDEEVVVADNDGVTDVVENGAPNSGDANNDGSQDSEQSTVASLLDPNNDYISLEIEGAGCTQLQNVYTTVESAIGVEDNDFDFPLGLVGFEAPCASSITVTHYWYGADPAVDYVYRKYGNLTPGDNSTAQWYDWDVLLEPTTINGEYVLKAVYTLTDGQFGDDTATDGLIIDPSGPSPAPVTTTEETSTSVLDSEALIRTGGF